MSWRNTWLLVGVAVALFAFIVLYERHLNPTDGAAPIQPLLTAVRPSEAIALTIGRGQQFERITLERTNGNWRYVEPRYPAASLAVQGFLEALERVVPTAYITAQEILARKQTSADFGFDAPLSFISLQSPNGREALLRFGARTPAQDQVYAEVVGNPGVYVVSAEILDRLPRTRHDWRDTVVFPFNLQELNRCEVVRQGSAYLLQKDSTNQLWRLTRPAHRADQFAVQQLIQRIEATRVLEFVTDNPGADLESFGLQAPVAEIELGGGGTVQRLQIGRSPTNDPGRVFAQLGNTSNVVLVSKSVLEVASVPYTQLRDPRLLAFAPELIDVVEVKSAETFTLKRQGKVWRVGDTAVDSLFVDGWLASLSELKVTEFVKDVVPAFASYGLAPPSHEFALKVTVTNAAGPTNIFIGQVAFGTNQSGVFARRSDEESVYSIHMRDYLHLPGAVWQLRDHRVWSFTTNQVTRVTVRQDGRVREFLRQADGEWTLPAGVTGNLNPFALEETLFRLGELTAVAWVGRGEKAREQFGFTTNRYQITIDLKDGAATRSLNLEFGGVSPLTFPYAATEIDGQTWVFEFPPFLWVAVQRYLNVPGAGTAGAPLRAGLEARF